MFIILGRCITKHWCIVHCTRKCLTSHINLIYNMLLLHFYSNNFIKTIRVSASKKNLLHLKTLINFIILLKHGLLPSLRNFFEQNSSIAVQAEKNSSKKLRPYYWPILSTNNTGLRIGFFFSFVVLSFIFYFLFLYHNRCFLCFSVRSAEKYWDFPAKWGWNVLKNTQNI